MILKQLAQSFVGSLTNSGGWQWVNNIGFGSQTTSMSIGGIVSDSYGNSIISGTYSGYEVEFSGTSGSLTLEYDLPTNNHAQSKVFVAKVTSFGMWMWGSQSIGKAQHLIMIFK